MKIDSIKTIIAVVISALLAYACYEICKFERVQWIITIGTFLTIGIPCVLSLGVSSKEKRLAVMLKTFSSIILTVEIVVNFVFVFFDFSVPVYVIVNGLLLLVFVLIYNSMYNSHKQ